MNDMRDALQAITPEYLTPPPDRLVDRQIVEFASEFIIPPLPGNRILELGVGDHVWTPRLLKRFAEVTTVDGSKELLDSLRQRLDGARWTGVHALFEEYLPEQRFDTLVATYVLEHVNDPAQILWLARHRWLKERGTVAVVVPHALSLHRRLATKMGLIAYPGELGDTDQRMGHQRCFTWYEMWQLLVDSGFRVLEQRGMFTKLLPNSALVHCSPAQLRGMFDLGLDLPIEYSAAIYFLAESTPL